MSGFTAEGVPPPSVFEAGVCPGLRRCRNLEAWSPLIRDRTLIHDLGLHSR